MASYLTVGERTLTPGVLQIRTASGPLEIAATPQQGEQYCSCDKGGWKILVESCPKKLFMGTIAPSLYATYTVTIEIAH